MKINKSILTSVVMVGISMAIFGVSVLAHEGHVHATSGPKARAELDRGMMRKMNASSTFATTTRATSTDRVCQNLTKRIEKRLSNFGGNSDRHVEVYIKHKDKLLQIIGKLSAEGLLSADLQAHVKVLEEKISKFSSDKEKVKEKLEDVAEFGCTDSSEGFRTVIGELRAAQLVVAADAKDIHDYIQKIIKQDLIDIRSSLK